ncbi:MAG: hypothetical protein HUU37_08235 [Bdellovibrionales bacterium]|nr:hypothetical protein [Bdellovibrionales bacterium]
MMNEFKSADRSVSILETGILIRTPVGEETHLAWGSVQGLKKSVFFRYPVIRGAGGVLPLRGFSPEEGSKLVAAVMAAWKSRFPDRARKNAFDYLDHNKGFAWVMLFSSLLFLLPVSGVLLNESREILACTKALKADGRWIEASVVRQKKIRAGHYNLWIEADFEGTRISGRDSYFTRSPDQFPPATLPVLASASAPGCWMITSSQGERVADWPRRKFFAAWIGLFGLSFLGMGAVGLAWTVGRFRQELPYRQIVSGYFW